MKNSLKLIIRLVFVLAFSAGAIFLAFALMDDLYEYRSPISESDLIPGRSFGEPMAERVVFVLVDALRYDTTQKPEVMPFLNQLRNQGAGAIMHSQPPSFSSPGYGTSLTGAWPYLSDTPPFNVTYEEFQPFTQDNIFSSAKRHGLRTAASGYYWFEKLIPADALDIGFFTEEYDQKADRLVVDAAIPWLESRQYNLIFIHLDQVDYAGHYEGGPQGEKWNQAANRVDSLIAEIVAEMDFSKDVLVISSDHGQIDQGGHGGHEQITMIEPFIMVGSKIKAGVYDEMQMVDIAPTISALLGINLPASTQGRVLTEMINMPRSVQNELKNATARQQSQLLAAYASAIGQPLPAEVLDADPNLTVKDYQAVLVKMQQAKLNRERLIRFGIGALVIIMAALLVRKWKPKGWLKLVFAAILFTALFHVSYITFGLKLYSHSIIVDELQLLLSNGIITIIALAITLLLFTFQNWIAMDIKQNFIKVLDIGLFLMLVTAMPLVAHILWNGLFSTWMLPNFALQYLALLSLIQIIFIGVGLVFISLAAGIILISRGRKTA